MKTRIYIIIIGVIAVLSLEQTHAQNLLDAYRYSFQNPSGTARFNGVSGAMNAIGADISLGSHNPAGIAAFWKSELAVSGDISLLNSDASLLEAGNSNSTSGYGNSLNNAGVVFTSYTPNKNWMSKSFAIGYNTMANYVDEVFYEGKTLGSISERWGALGNGLFPDDLDDFEAGPAFDAGVIFDNEGDAIYEYDYFRHEDQKLYRNQTIAKSGKWSELAVSFGGNYNNKLLLGATIGIDFISFEVDKSYTESDLEDENVPQFNELRYRELLSSSGVGVNAKLGALLKITESIRWSASISSPTSISIRENFRNLVNYEWVNNDGTIGNGSWDTDENQFEYSFVNPWKVSTGFGYMVGKNGFIDAEIDYVGYNFSKFKFSDGVASDIEYENFLNQEIDSRFENALNFRIGGEFVTGSFRVRGGYQLYGSPLEGIDNMNGFSLGLGYRGENWFLDLAYVNRSQVVTYQPYELLDAVVPTVDIDRRISNIGLTIGFKI